MADIINELRCKWCGKRFSALDEIDLERAFSPRRGQIYCDMMDQRLKINTKELFVRAQVDSCKLCAHERRLFEIHSVLRARKRDGTIKYYR